MSDSAPKFKGRRRIMAQPVTRSITLDQTQWDVFDREQQQRGLDNNNQLFRRLANEMQVSTEHVLEDVLG